MAILKYYNKHHDLSHALTYCNLFCLGVLFHAISAGHSCDTKAATHIKKICVKKIIPSID